MNKGIYAILDKKANDFAGPLQLLRNDTVAVRLFDDVAGREDNMVSRHVNDHELVKLGEVDDTTHELIPGYQLILTGSAWAAAKQTASGEEQ